MSMVFNKINESQVQTPSFLYIRKALCPYLSAFTNGITAAYDLVLLNRESDKGNFGQVFVEVGYSVTSYLDNFEKKIDRKIATENLKEGGVDHNNYFIFNLGIGYDAEAVDYYKSSNEKVILPKNPVPLRLIDKANPRPWVLQKDMDLTKIVQDKVMEHFYSNEYYF